MKKILLFVLVMSSVFCLKAVYGQEAFYGLSGFLESIRHPQMTKTSQKQIKMISSYNRDNNIDWGNFVCPCKAEDQECVLADLQGPGEIIKIFVTLLIFDWDKHIKIYIDDNLIIDQPILDLFSGSFLFFSDGFVLDYELSCGGYVLYFPISFSKSAKVTIERPLILVENLYLAYYHIIYRTFGPETEIESFSLDIIEKEFKAYQQILDIFLNLGRDPKQIKDLETIEKDLLLEPNSQSFYFDFSEPGFLSSFEAFIADQYDSYEILKDVYLEFYWDDDDMPGIRAPFKMFFGGGLHSQKYRSLFLGNYYNYFPMPFEKAKIKIENLGRSQIPLKIKIAYQDMIRQTDSSRLKTVWTEKKTEIDKDIVLLDFQGKGHLAGIVLNISHFGVEFWPFNLADPACVFMEGDMTIYADGQEAPVFAYTGMEELFDAGWYLIGSIFDMYFSAIASKTKFKISEELFNYQIIMELAAHKLFIAEAVPFEKSIKINQEYGINNQIAGDQVSALIFLYAEK